MHIYIPIMIIFASLKIFFVVYFLYFKIIGDNILKTFSITLSDEEYKALQAEAKRQKRAVKAQAETYISEAINPKPAGSARG